MTPEEELQSLGGVMVATPSPNDELAALGGRIVGARPVDTASAPALPPEVMGATAKTPEELEQAYQAYKTQSERPFTDKLKDVDWLQAGKNALGGVWNFFASGPYNVAKNLAQQGFYGVTGDPRYFTKTAEAGLALQNAERQSKELWDSTGGKAINWLSNNAWTASPEFSLDDMSSTGNEERLAQSKENTLRADFQRRVDNAKAELSLSQGRPIDSGPTAAIFKARQGEPISTALSPESLQAVGAPEADTEASQKMAGFANPTNILLAEIPAIPGASKVGGALTKGLGVTAQLPMDLLERGAGGIARMGPYGRLTTAVVGADGLMHTLPLAVHHPVAAIGTIAGVGAAKGLQKLGQAMEAQGGEMMTGIPSSLTTRVATSRALGELDKSALAGMKLGNMVGTGLATGLGYAPINALASDGDPQKFIEGELNAGAFGTIMGAKPNRAMMTEAIRPYLRSEGARTMDVNSDLGQKSLGYIQSLSPEAQDRIFETMGALQGFKTKGANGEEAVSQFYPLNSADYAAERARYDARMKAAGITTNAPGSGVQGRGFFQDANGRVILNADIHGGTPDLIHTMGHEGGHVIAAIMNAAGAKGGEIYNNLLGEARKGLINSDGSPTKEFQNFIDAYNKNFDPSGKTQRINAKDPSALEEFLAEQSGRIMAGEAPDYALPYSLSEKLQRGVDRFAGKFLGVDTRKVGQQTSYLNKDEIGGVTQAMRDTLAQLMQMPRAERPPDIAPQDQPSTQPLAPSPTPASPVAPAPAFDRGDVSLALQSMFGMNKRTADQFAAQAQGEDLAEAIGHAMSMAQQSRSNPPPIGTPLSQGVPTNPASTAPLASVTPAVEAKPQNVPVPIQTVQGGTSPEGVATNPSQRLSDNLQDKGATEVAQVPAQETVDYQQRIKDALAQAEQNAAEPMAKAKGGKNKPKEVRQAEILREHRTNALAGLLEPNNEGLLQPVTDPETGEVKFKGNIDPTNPIHDAILDEFGYTPEQKAQLLDAQNRQGEGVWLRDYNSAKQEGFETGEGLDFTGEKRNEEYSKSTAAERLAGKGETSKQDKPVTILGTQLTGKGPVINTFDHDKFLNNVREISAEAEKQGIKLPIHDLKGKERDAYLSKSVQDYSENQANGWKGDGSAPLDVFPDSGITVNPDYVGKPVDKATADMLNLAMHNERAKPPEAPNGKTELAQKKFAKAQDFAKQAQGLNRANQGFINDEGETNPLRAQLTQEKDENKEPIWNPEKILKPVFSTVQPNLIEGGIHDTPTHGKSVHAHGFDIPPRELTAQGFPRQKQVAAGFMPEENTHVSNFMPEQREQDELGFYSKVGQIVKDKIPNRASGEQILATLKSNGAKQEEMETLGLPQFLQGKQNVTKQEVNDFIKANTAPIKEVIKGAGENIEVRQSRGPNPTWQIYDRAGDRVIAGGYDSREEAQSDIPTVARESGSRIDNTKFSQYTIPGGTNYREVLLTLPEKFTKQDSGLTRIHAETKDGVKIPPFELPNSTLREALKPLDREGFKYTTEPVLITNKEEPFHSTHFDEPNILAHSREADHVDTEGNNVRLLEEVQSDWHQKGRKEGYQGDTAALKKNLIEVESRLRASRDKLQNLYMRQSESAAAEKAYRDYYAEHQKINDEYGKAQDDLNEAMVGAPNAPYKATDAWAGLVFKRALRRAVEDGMDKIAWTPGQVHTDRYGTERIEWDKQPDGSYLIDAKSQHGGRAGGIDLEGEANARGLNPTSSDRVSSEKELRDTIKPILTEGQDADSLAKKLWNRMQSEPQGVSMPRKEGFKGFYDKILPDFVKKYVKPWGGKVETSLLKKADNWTNDEVSRNPDFALRHDAAIPVHSVAITPQMKEAVMGGQARFMPESSFQKLADRNNWIYNGKIEHRGITLRMFTDNDPKSPLYQGTFVVDGKNPKLKDVIDRHTFKVEQFSRGGNAWMPEDQQAKEAGLPVKQPANRFSLPALPLSGLGQDKLRGDRLAPLAR